MNTKQINLKTSKSSILLGITLILFAAGLSALMLTADKGDSGDWIGSIVILVIFALPLGIFGIGSIIGYFQTRKVMNGILAEYGEDTIRSHVQFATFKTMMSGVTNKPLYYFTDAFILLPGALFIDYQMIDQMYRNEVHYKGNRSNLVNIRLQMLDGKLIDICNGIKDDEITGIMQLCRQHNPKIMLGYTEDMKMRHEQNVQAYKNGMLCVPKLYLERLTQPIMMPLAGMQSVQPTAPQLQPQQPRYSRQELCNYIEQNFPPDQKIMAIKYYRDYTGVGLAEAKDVVDRIYEQVWYDNNYLQTPWEWSKEGQMHKKGQKLCYIGGSMLGMVAVFAVLMTIVAISGSINLELFLIMAVSSVPILIPGIILCYFGYRKMKENPPR